MPDNWLMILTMKVAVRAWERFYKGIRGQGL